MPKKLPKMYQKFYKRYAEGQSKQRERHFKEVSEQLNEHASNNFKIEHTLNFFGKNSSLSPADQQENRKVMSKILQNHGAEEILSSGYIAGKDKKISKDKKANLLSYLMVSKVYGYRCRNKTLAARTQIPF